MALEEPMRKDCPARVPSPKNSPRLGFPGLLPACLGNDGEPHFAMLNVKDRIGRVALAKMVCFLAKTHLSCPCQWWRGMAADRTHASSWPDRFEPYRIAPGRSDTLQRIMPESWFERCSFLLTYWQDTDPLKKRRYPARLKEEIRRTNGAILSIFPAGKGRILHNEE